MPGAEGAPLVETGFWVLVVRFVVEVGCAEGGAMRRDFGGAGKVSWDILCVEVDSLPWSSRGEGIRYI